MASGTEKDYPLPGAYCSRRSSYENEPAALSLSIMSPVFFPSHGDCIMVKRRRNSSRRLPGAWVEEDEDVYDRSNIHLDELRQTIATLRKETQQLEETDVLLKKSIQIVARKRQLVKHRRRKQSQWVWCDDQQTTDEENDEDYLGMHDDQRVPPADVLLDDWEWV
ncbi:hypothetical protein EC973_002148 [Apophysomyces ossiformis]|uniref:Uncharacterized protein n=1 Tax=Apophysomyces ossiformis TaxID=679940 RepID=A0A8H7BP05_9FUNG|nr:hypothetical protein EC973_002148 [Apophysomyces ossiformis]